MNRAKSHSPSQRMLRVGEIVSVLIIFPAVAVAEVCDKAVGESWKPEDGPVWLLNPSLGGLIYIALIVLGVIGIFKSRAWHAGLIVAFLLAAWAILGLLELLNPDVVLRGMFREGCASYNTNLFDAGFALVAAAAYAFAGFRFWQFWPK